MNERLIRKDGEILTSIWESDIFLVGAILVAGQALVEAQVAGESVTVSDCGLLIKIGFLLQETPA